jgi:hypothetical protein
MGVSFHVAHFTPYTKFLTPPRGSRSSNGGTSPVLERAQRELEIIVAMLVKLIQTFER